MGGGGDWQPWDGSLFRGWVVTVDNLNQTGHPSLIHCDAVDNFALLHVERISLVVMNYGNLSPWFSVNPSSLVLVAMCTTVTCALLKCVMNFPFL